MKKPGGAYFVPDKHYEKCVNFLKEGTYEKCIECKTPGDCPKYQFYRCGGDTVNHPAHYTDGKIEVIDFIEDKKLGFCLGNAVKYIARAGKKDPTKEVEDLKKAEWYIKRRIKELEEVCK
jgi:hypothetical protein